MRVVAHIVGIVAGLIGIGAACAADIASVAVHRGAALYGSATGERAGQIVLWAFEPGVAVRPYWCAPWRNRHYFPATGKRPRIGRRENRHARASGTVPARTFMRTWTTSAAFAANGPHGPLPGTWSTPSQPGPLLK
jgi:hypothetical protein